MTKTALGDLANHIPNRVGVGRLNAALSPVLEPP